MPRGPFEEATRRRERGHNDFLRYAVGRPLVFALWVLILWGTLYLLAWLYSAGATGPATAIGRAVSGQDTFGGMANLTLAGVALVVWILVGLGVALRHRRRTRNAREARAVRPRGDEPPSAAGRDA